MNKDTRFINEGNALSFNIGGFAVHPVGGNAWFGSDFRNILLTAVGTGTIIVYGSAQKVPPDFSAPSTITNSYVPIMLADYTTPNTYYAGGTGVAVAGSSALVELNTNLLTWIGIHRSADTVDVLLTETNNQ